MPFKEQAPPSLFSLDQWIAGCFALAIGVGALTSFFYVNFQTKESFDEYKESQLLFQEAVDRKLERIEDKLDRALKK